ncbi:hypothetical protein BDR26DRAFT_404213 [Obelidium mucronatum]|nr:hypothetical protein BDR26DRAFT_404213 [Obelidium mucronatum]
MADHGNHEEALDPSQENHDEEITQEDIEAHLAAQERQQTATATETATTPSTSSSSGGGGIKPTTGETNNNNDSDDHHENTALSLLTSIVKQHTAFDEEKEEEEIAQLVKVALQEDTARPPNAQTPDGTGGEEHRELTEDEKIMQQVKNTIRFLQENIANPNSANMDDYNHANVGDPNFNVRMRAEYENLYRLFITARRNNQGLVKKLRDMKNEIVSNATKVEAAMKIFQEDRILIASLKKEVKKAWTVVELTKDREIKAKDTVFNLKFQLDTVKKELGKVTGTDYQSKSGTDKGVNMVQMNLELQMKIDQLDKDKVELNRKLSVANGDIRILNTEVQDLNEKINLEKRQKEKAIEEMDLVNNLLQTEKIRARSRITHPLIN